MDRELCLPRSWAEDRGRCEAAGIPQETVFATKPELACRMIERAVAAGVSFGWFAGNEVYGDNGKLHTRLGEAQIATCCRCPRAPGPRWRWRSLRADEFAARLPKRA